MVSSRTRQSKSAVALFLDNVLNISYIQSVSKEPPMRNIKIVIERHEDGYLGYPLGFSRGAIVGEGDTYAAALKDTESAIRFFIKQYGKKRFFEHVEPKTAALDAYIAETSIAV
jgi:hypothetical protein